MRTDASPIAAVKLSTVPTGADDVIGIFVQVTAPAFGSNESPPPMFNEPTDVTPVDKSYESPPLPTSKPPANVEVAVVEVAVKIFATTPLALATESDA